MGRLTTGEVQGLARSLCASQVAGTLGQQTHHCRLFPDMLLKPNQKVGGTAHR